MMMKIDVLPQGYQLRRPTEADIEPLYELLRDCNIDEWGVPGLTLEDARSWYRLLHMVCNTTGSNGWSMHFARLTRTRHLLWRSESL
jgi:hypothetical protein